MDKDIRAANPQLVSEDRNLAQESELDAFLSHVQNRESELAQINQGLRQKLTEAQARLKAATEVVFYCCVQLSGVRGTLGSSLKVMEGLCKSAREIFKEEPARGGRALPVKVGTIVVEQWAIEIDNLKKMDDVLTEAIEAQKRFQS